MGNLIVADSIGMHQTVAVKRMGVAVGTQFMGDWTVAIKRTLQTLWPDSVDFGVGLVALPLNVGVTQKTWLREQCLCKFCLAHATT